MAATLTEDLEDLLLRKIKTLNERIWEFRADAPILESWLDNFRGEVMSASEERLHALYLLSHFMYFGSRETRELLKCLYRDLYKYPIIEFIRKANNDSTDHSFLDAEYHKELEATRFLGVGSPAESGTHLLYYFRQENVLPKELFINSHQIFSYSQGSLSLRDPDIKRYVFIDDLAGSGHQARMYSQDIVKAIKALKPQVHVSYYVVFATTQAISSLQNNTLFDEIKPVFDLDPSFRCFSSESRYYDDDTLLALSDAEAIMAHYGGKLSPNSPLGFAGGQMLLGFHHNTPDNTLPVIWAGDYGSDWEPIFRRYPKVTW